MDTVAIALRSAVDEANAVAAIRQAGCVCIQGPAHDPETAAGRARATEIFGWQRWLFVSLAASDRTSAPLLAESFERFLEDRETPLERLVRAVARSAAHGPIDVVCCFEWEADGQITRYVGGVEAFAVWLRLNGGPYRTTCPSGTPRSLTPDLDVPLVWRLTPGD